MMDVNLQKAHLAGANFQNANLVREGNFQSAGLREANLQGAWLVYANLQSADLREANLQGAYLFGANLESADLAGAKLQGAYLNGAKLTRVIFEPTLESLPQISVLLDNRLEDMVFHTSPAALLALREAFKKAGMRTQERQLTYAVKHTERLQAWDPSIKHTWRSPRNPFMTDEQLKAKYLKDTRPWLERLAGKSESLFNHVLFELPSGYGMVPSRAFATLGLLILGFSFVYMVGVLTARGRAGIWVTWPTDRVYQEEGAKEATRVTNTLFFPRLQARAAGRWWGVLLRGLCIPLIGLYFSFLSAFSLGWRELNVGTWVSRMQPREYILRATGWVRMVSGIQSLLSVYLLALWVLTYFGRPFE
jgi:hypothetical protein